MWRNACGYGGSEVSLPCCCSKIAEAEAAVSVNEKEWLVMHMHVQLKLDELWAPPNPCKPALRVCLGPAPFIYLQPHMLPVIQS
jgi:hypothetical protein